jgi:tetratricopeptide (TPR) repeat protein
MKKFTILFVVMLSVFLSHCHNPINVETAKKMRGMALKYTFSNNPSMGLKYFDSALYYNYKYADAYAGKSLVLLSIHDYKGAMENINKAIKYDSENGSWYYNKGFIYYELGKYDKAFKYFDKCIASNDVLKKQALYYKGVIYLLQGDTIAGKVNLRAALDLGYVKAAELLDNPKDHVRNKNMD